MTISKKWVMAFVSAFVLFAAASGFAQMKGGMGGMGAGMVITADDGSVLITRMGRGMMGSQQQRALVAINANGSIRWKINFADRWPMAPATKGDLVVVSLVDDSWMGGATGKAYLEAVKLSTGAALWKVVLDGQMASYPQFSRDGKRIYVTVGDYSGTYTMAAKKLVAFDLNGNALWTVNITGTEQMGLARD